MLKKPEVIIFDVDGVLTTGQFLYTSEGKYMKIFGPDDNDALSLLKQYLEIRFITGDKKGFSISEKRIVEDMKYPLDLVSTIQRSEWIEKNWPLDSVIYMGDGIFDHYVFKKVAYAITTQDADINAKRNANYITERSGGKRAVAEACLHVMEKFFEAYDPNKLPDTQIKKTGEWTVQ